MIINILEGELAEMVFEPRAGGHIYDRANKLDRHGEGWEAMRDAVGSPQGWAGSLARFAARATEVGARFTA